MSIKTWKEVVQESIKLNEFNSGLVKFEDNHFCIKIFDGETYDIPFKECDTPDKLIKWIDHLSQKQWVTKDHIKRLIDLFSAKTGIDFYQN